MNIINLSSEITDYAKAEELMDKTREDVINGAKNTIIILQHDDTLTCGNQKPEESIEKEVIHINRGGGLTYHNKGQLVFYFIFNLKTINLSIHDFIEMLERATINTLKEYQIQAHNDKQTGVWVDDRKIASIGLNVKKHTTKYGIAININNDLSFFKKFSPCGIKNCEIISVSKIKKHDINIGEFAEKFINQFAIICK